VGWACARRPPRADSADRRWPSGCDGIAKAAEDLRDRSSRPHRLRQPTSPELVVRVEALRRERWTGYRIAQATGLSLAVWPQG